MIVFNDINAEHLFKLYTRKKKNSFFHIFVNTNYHFFNNNHPNRCKVISPCSFDLHFPED